MAEPEPLAERLPVALGRHWDEPVRVDELRRLSGGASREIWSCTATTTVANPRYLAQPGA